MYGLFACVHVVFELMTPLTFVLVCANPSLELIVIGIDKAMIRINNNVKFLPWPVIIHS